MAYVNYRGLQRMKKFGEKVVKNRTRSAIENIGKLLWVYRVKKIKNETIYNIFYKP